MEEQPPNELNTINQDQNKNTTNFLIYAFGKNKEGQLSLGHNRAVNVPKPVKILKMKVVEQIYSAGQHTAVVLQGGEILVVGSALHGKLGIEDLQFTHIVKFQRVPRIANLGYKVKQVACGDYHTLCLFDNGKIHAWGGTLHKKLGQKSSAPQEIEAFSKQFIIQIGCGDFHSVALTNEGEVYTWGGGGQYNKGQLGHGQTNLIDNESPKQVQALKGKFVKKISVGGYHTMILTSLDEIYSWGSGTYGECGYGEEENFYDEQPKIMDIACGGHHTLFLSNKGHVYTCGYGSHGQLGLKSNYNQCEPQLVIYLLSKKVKAIAAGWNHSLLLTENNDVYSCGFGASGQLGQGDDESKTMFTQIKALAGMNVKRIYAGGNSSWAVLDEINPINSYYLPPTPLHSPAATPRYTQKFYAEESQIDQKKEELVSTDQTALLDGLLSMDRGIQISFTDVELSHRFIRITCSESTKEIVRTALDSYINELFNIESGILYYNILEDSEIEIENENMIQKVEIPKNCASYTLMIICDLQKNMSKIPKEKFPIPYVYLTEQSNQIIGEQVFLKENDLLKSEAQCILSNWMLLFNKKSSSPSLGIEKIKYFELRPIQFK